jgi:hypothetical protein
MCILVHPPVIVSGKPPVQKLRFFWEYRLLFKSHSLHRTPLFIVIIEAMMKTICKTTRTTNNHHQSTQNYIVCCPGVEPGENPQGLFFLFLEENPVRVWEIPKKIPEAFSLRKSYSRMTRVLEISSKFLLLYISKTKRHSLEKNFAFNFYSSSPTTNFFFYIHFENTLYI